jgi:hypothetical protein
MQIRHHSKDIIDDLDYAIVFEEAVFRNLDQ